MAGALLSANRTWKAFRVPATVREGTVRYLVAWRCRDGGLHTDWQERFVPANLQSWMFLPSPSSGAPLQAVFFISTFNGDRAGRRAVK
jgi:hypothetical protein